MPTRSAKPRSPGSSKWAFWRSEEGRFLWVFRSRRYPIVDGKAEREVKLRIMGVLLSDEIPDPRDIAIIGLCDACGILDHMMAPRELAQARAAHRPGQQAGPDRPIGGECDRADPGIEPVALGTVAPGFGRPVGRTLPARHALVLGEVWIHRGTRAARCPRRCPGSAGTGPDRRGSPHRAPGPIRMLRLSGTPGSRMRGRRRGAWGGPCPRAFRTRRARR